MQSTRITINPDRMGGAPCLRGLRMPVATVVDMVANGMTEAEIFQAFPDIERDDITEALATLPKPPESVNCPCLEWHEISR